MTEKTFIVPAQPDFHALYVLTGKDLRPIGFDLDPVLAWDVLVTVELYEGEYIRSVVVRPVTLEEVSMEPPPIMRPDGRIVIAENRSFEDKGECLLWLQSEWDKRREEWDKKRKEEKES